MDSISKNYTNIPTVNSTLGKMAIDSSGSPISCVRLDTNKAYGTTPELVEKFINNHDVNAWAELTNKIDYIYSHINTMLTKLNEETSFYNTIKSEINSGKKILFKPNLNAPFCIDCLTHSEGAGEICCTHWTVIAALMRWFHDKLNISYYQMCVAEASSGTFYVAGKYSKLLDKPFTTEAIIEGRNGNLYGGWGFFFVRQYLSDRHPASHHDNPMNGYNESINGIFIPPGKATDKLMVYDINKILKGSNRGRTLKVPGGVNFKEITLHKIIVGGDPNNIDDVIDYPGCVLINVPKLKMHGEDLITNAIKNLGIGLYPSQCPAEDGSSSWKYAYPPNTNPSLKGKLPHSPWIFHVDDNTHLPIMDKNGKYLNTKTAGFSGTQTDVIKVVQSQNIFMLNVNDGLNFINICHDPDGGAIKIPEGFIFASLDCVALDVFCSRYCINMIPMAEGLKLKKENNWNTEFVRPVPVAKVQGKNIVTKEGFDSPLFRYDLYRFSESRGIGIQNYYVVGFDSLSELPFASLLGHLGVINNNNFTEVVTKTFYYNPLSFLHHLQKTSLSYSKSVDSLTGSSAYKDIMDTYDENHDGVISYNERGRGYYTARLSFVAYTQSLESSNKFSNLIVPFLTSVYHAKYYKKDYNAQGHDFTKEVVLVSYLSLAHKLSQSENIQKDKFVKSMSYGKGQWPSWKTVEDLSSQLGIFGSTNVNNISLNSSYGGVFQYADKVLNNGLYTGSTDPNISDPSAFNKYLKALANGAKPLNFTIYMPTGYGKLDNTQIPNVEETDDPEKIYSVNFLWYYEAFGITPPDKNITSRKEQSMFEFEPNKTYHMPVFFGGEEFDKNLLAISNDVSAINLTITTDKNQLNKYIPKEFTLLKPDISISFNQLKEVDFLEGRGYNLIEVSVPVRFNGKVDTIDGVLPLVIWENNTQPITGGREEDGQPKIFADIQDMHVLSNKCFTNASHNGNTFLEIEISNLEKLPIKNNHISKNAIGYRYIPKVGEPGYDLCQCILYPQSCELKEKWTGTGNIKWITHSLSKYPYGYKIINALSNLPIYNISAEMVKQVIIMKPYAGRVLK